MRRGGRNGAVSAVGLAVLLTLSIAAAGCGGSSRSTQAFCTTLNQGTANLKAAAQQTMHESKRNALLGLVSAFGSIGDFEQFLDRLNKAAPSPIESDMNTIDQDFHNSISSSGSAAAGLVTGNPAGLAELLFKQLIHANSYRRVDQFAAANCGTSVFAPAGS